MLQNKKGLHVLFFMKNKYIRSMRLRPENLFYKKERCIDAFFQKKKDEKKKETF